jgi:hypothetical protein
VLTVGERKRRRLEAVRRWKKKNPDKVKQHKRNDYLRMDLERRNRIRRYNLERAQQLRRELLAALGDRCVRCGFGDWRALQVDHVNGGGSRERATLNLNRTSYYQKILSRPERYQLLCANCNWIKRYEREEHRWNIGREPLTEEPDNHQFTLFVKRA